MGDQRRRQRDECAGAEAVERCEKNGGRVCPGGEPESQDDDGAEICDYYHGVEAAVTVGNEAGNGAAEDRSSVKDGKEVGSEVGGHADNRGGFNDDEVEGDVEAEEEEKRGDDDQAERRLVQGCDKLHEAERFGGGGKAGFDGQVCENEHEKNQEGGGAHSPWEADFWDKLLDKDRKDYLERSVSIRG